MLGNISLIGGFCILILMMLVLQADELHWHNPGRARWLGVLAVVLGWLGLVGWLRFRRQQSTNAEASGGLDSAKTSDAIAPTPTHSRIKIWHASQTGFADQLAQQTMHSLQAGGMVASSDAFDNLDIDALRAMDRVLFVVSTTGEGDPPDIALKFQRAAMRQPADLIRLQFGLLALGDSDYEDFCGFGRELHHWLQASGAQPLFDPVEVDRGDEAALRHWQHHLAMLSGAHNQPDWQAPEYQRWQLIERRRVNDGSVGAPCFHLALKPSIESESWQAGDLVEIGPCQAPDDVAAWLLQSGLDGHARVKHDGTQQPLAALLASCDLPALDTVDGLDEMAVASLLHRLPHREYSIASLPTDGAIHLLVREMIAPDGRLGMGSSWLCRHAAIGADIALRIRSNPNFHAPQDGRPLILIGNGTGMAALRSLLKQRWARGHHRNWLLFGERQAAHDFYYRDEIEGWQRDGHLERVDFAWSRDQAERIHVQQLVQESSDELARWVEAGAAIHVCGSLDGMAPGVERVLRKVLGAEQVEQLREQGRYRRDVY